MSDNLNTLKRCLTREVLKRDDDSFSWRRVIYRAWCCPERRYLFWWRIANYLFFSEKNVLKKLAKRIEFKIRYKYNVEIELGASIGEGLGLAHLSGIVINNDCKIGKNAFIKQGVTLGRQAAYPAPVAITIGDNVDIGCNTTILGGTVDIGDNVTIGAHSLVLKSIPSNSIYTNKITPNIREK